jgi:fatty-acyl-CoA synthase
VIAKTFDSADSLRLIEQERCTIVLGVPTIYQMWLDSGEVAKRDLSSVRFFLSGGAPCPVPLIHRWRETTGIALRQGYGMSEVGVNCFSMSDAESISKAGSVGKPIYHLAARIVDESGRDVADGETGELIFRGKQVCAGYLNNPDATTQTIRNGWFYTGDMARRDAEGYFAIIGRFKDMIISGGENVYAAEVEAVFMEHPAVQECALVGKADQKWGEVGVLFVVIAEDTHTPRTTHHALRTNLLTHSRERLARYKVPKEIVFLDELPHSPYGKVEKIKLKERFLN